MEYQVTTESGFEFNIVPFYLWLPGYNGSVALEGPLGGQVGPAKIDLTPIDILSNLGDFLDALDGLYMGSGEVRYGKVGLVYDIFYLDVSSTAEIEGSALPVNADVGFSQVMATVLGSYRVLESDTMHVDLLGGIRIQDIDISIDLNILDQTLPVTGDSTWVDPIFGAKGRMQLSENWYASGTALVGGFGVSSDIVWDVSANLGYQWNNWLDLYAGFRGAGTDYKSGNFVWDVTQYGPVMGGMIRF
ncbi:MAG: hypothetical protein V2I51_20685 [Anderseniella sp.]|jgi:hypothetical protein|nr:hypothetical protein [Anderseniella sp.]